MGAGRVGDIADRLVAGGLPPETPVAAVRNGTRADQQTVRATLATIADAGVRAPAAIVVGEVAGIDLAVVRDAAALRPLGGRDPCPRAGERAPPPPRKRSAPRSSSCPAIAIEPLAFDAARPRPATRGSSSRRRTAWPRSSSAASRPPGSTPAPSPASGSPPSARALPLPSPRTRLAHRPTARAVRGRVAAGGVPAAGSRRRACAARPGRAGAVTCFPPGLSERGYAVDVLPRVPDRDGDARSGRCSNGCAGARSTRSRSRRRRR